MNGRGRKADQTHCRQVLLRQDPIVRGQLLRASQERHLCVSLIVAGYCHQNGPQGEQRHKCNYDESVELIRLYVAETAVRRLWMCGGNVLFAPLGG